MRSDHETVVWYRGRVVRRMVRIDVRGVELRSFLPHAVSDSLSMTVGFMGSKPQITSLQTTKDGVSTVNWTERVLCMPMKSSKRQIMRWR